MGLHEVYVKSWVVSGIKVSKFVSVDQHWIINFLTESHILHRSGVAGLGECGIRPF